MARIMKNLISLLFFLTMVCGAYAQQSQAAMQAQMNAAGTLQSAAANPTFATPLATYQQYYPAFTGGHSQTMCACLNATAMQDFTDGGTTMTAQQYASLDSQWQQNGFGNFQLLSFVFATNPTSPTITIQYSCVQNQITMKEQLVLTLADSNTGWLINSIVNQELP
jgi:hypothetical protein